jgi:hypothetical protein
MTLKRLPYVGATQLVTRSGYREASHAWAVTGSGVVSSREYPADADIQRNPSPFTYVSDLPKQFMRVRVRPAFSPFQADDASSILVGRSRQKCSS